MRVLIFGATGMLGSALIRSFSTNQRHSVWGTIRDEGARRFFAETPQLTLVGGVDVRDDSRVNDVIKTVHPDIVINAAGVIKQLEIATDASIVFPINSEFPHRLAHLCAEVGARMIQISSDCVFSGRLGNYVEADTADANDLYGRSKFLGEIAGQSHVITLRTSIIGHELASTNSLVDWFLSQEGEVRGFSNAIYSGLPSIELARVIENVVFQHDELYGVYHVSSSPIAKFDLLANIARVYGKKIKIVPDDSVRINRSLDSSRFCAATGYIAPGWPHLIDEMFAHRT